MSSGSTTTDTSQGRLQKPPQPGYVYGDERHASDSGTEPTYPEQFQVVFIDSERVLLQNLDATDYRYERRDPFEDAIGTRWTLLDQEDVDESSRADVPEITPFVSILEVKAESYRRSRTEANRLKAEAIEDAIQLLEGHQPTTIDWSEVDGIGEKTAEQLVDHGFSTDADLAVASDEQLREIPGIGEKNLANARKYIESN
ncbi:helix-hairpin-helix domain-containing protein [Halorubrum sp. ASP1]|uniref:helix-hairpin-helix domain-containing protein n=1 Tax=Halorubrum sp. ASP1 TaxID=2518114 RepID=UPI0010F45938|nr:helix-hairpin-helix domain-containing protein [Halorubrum sp. ASP1]TKX60677.1 helix-hairpin-helix domain-containing protein [Halorubrum sp. ASP1]